MATKGTILVTGANGGLGSALAAQVASKPELSAYHGLYTVRDAGHAPALNAALAQGPAHKHDILSLDLAKLDDVRSVAKEISRRVSTGEIPPIRALILNAAFQDCGKQQWTEDGFDTVFAVNYLGHWLLTILLLGSMDNESGRIVILGSQSYDTLDPRNASTHAFDDPKYKYVLSGDDIEGRFNAIARGEWSPTTEDATFWGGFRRYGASKLFLIMMQHELQARLLRSGANSRICVLGVDPGAMPSGIVRRGPLYIRVLLYQIIFPIMLFFNAGGEMVRTPARSAGDVLEAASGAVGEGGELPRDLYFDGRKLCETSEESRDAGKRAVVWRETVKLAGWKEGDTVLENLR